MSIPLKKVSRRATELVDENRDHSFNMYKNFPKKNWYFLPPDTFKSILPGVKNNSFSENFAYVLNKWSHKIFNNMTKRLNRLHLLSLTCRTARENSSSWYIKTCKHFQSYGTVILLKKFKSCNCVSQKHDYQF